MKTCFLSIDVEKKENEASFSGVENLNNILDIFRKHNADATLFVTGEVLASYSELARKWSKDFEIGCHNYHHFPLDEIDPLKREEQLKKYIEIYRDIFKETPKGFRAPRNIIDNSQILLLEACGFFYDSSVIPRHPLRLKPYAGYRGKAPLTPYFPDRFDYRKIGNMKILEIPETPLIFNIPMVGTWLRKLGAKIFF